jgi:regulator of nucleoside diphosphate kinase
LLRTAAAACAAATKTQDGYAVDHTIYLTQKDLERLENLLPTVQSSDNILRLEEELGRAVVLPSEQIPPDVVTMNSRVRVFDASENREMTITLVYPSQADASAGKISVLAPVGSALLGLSVGQSIEWPLPDGRRKILRISEVLYQPEASGDLHL